MPTWVPLARAEKIPAVLNAYPKISQFRDAVKAQVKGSATWAKKQPSKTNVSPGSGGILVNVEAIPRVKVLRKSGRPK